MVTGIRNEEAPPWSNEPLPRMAHCDSGSLQLCGHHVLTNTQIQIHQSKYKYNNPNTNTPIRIQISTLAQDCLQFTVVDLCLQIQTHLTIIFQLLQNILVVFFAKIGNWYQTKNANI